MIVFYLLMRDLVEQRGAQEEGCTKKRPRIPYWKELHHCFGQVTLYYN